MARIRIILILILIQQISSIPFFFKVYSIAVIRWHLTSKQFHRERKRKKSTESFVQIASCEYWNRIIKYSTENIILWVGSTDGVDSKNFLIKYSILSMKWILLIKCCACVRSKYVIVSEWKWEREIEWIVKENKLTVSGVRMLNALICEVFEWV